jgi:NADH-quinone oxidoreductase subunit N
VTPTIPTWTELRPLLPEIWLVLTMCALLVVPFVRRHDARPLAAVTIGGLLLALLSVVGSLPEAAALVFHGTLTVDPFSQFFKILLLVFTLGVTAQWLLVGRARLSVLDVPDYLCLIVGAAVGMALMASASNFLMMVLAVEAASLPSYALAGFRKRERSGSEGALKYVLFGAASSAIMIYGISLIYGLTGSLDFAAVAVAATAPEGMSPLLAIGLLGMLAGVAFKLSAVPMHFWCPDVFEGAPIEITTFLSVASKGAAVCLLARLMYAFGGGATLAGHEPLVGLAVGVAILGAVTATWGNFAALAQNNIRRLLAYSSIAHAGYMIMGASALAIAGPIAVGDSLLILPTEVTAPLLFYLLVYAFMNLGAFTVAAVVAAQTGSDDIRDYAAMTSRSPLLMVLMSLFLLSLFGMPGLGGFLGKVFLMTAMAKLGPGGFALIAVLLVNTLVSLYYYVRPIYFMVLARDDRQRPAVLLEPAVAALLVLCAVGVVWTGVSGGSRLARDHAAIRLPAAETHDDTSVVVARDGL